jgi:hypothetical protein
VLSVLRNRTYRRLFTAQAVALAAAVIWPARDPARLDHVHTDLPSGHPHLAGARPADGGWRHDHHYVIDRYHHSWPPTGAR